MGLVTFLAVFAGVLPFVKPYAKTYTDCAGTGPSADHWLGCDNIGRDLFSRIAYGGQVSLFIGLMVVLLSIVVGGAIGLLAGYYRGKTDTVLTTLIDTILAIPPLDPAAVRGHRARTEHPEHRHRRRHPRHPHDGADRARQHAWCSRERDFVTAAQDPRGEEPAHHLAGDPAQRDPAARVLHVPRRRHHHRRRGHPVVPRRQRSAAPTDLGEDHRRRSHSRLDVHPLVAILPGLVIFFTVLSLNIISDSLREKFDVREAGI